MGIFFAVKPAIDQPFGDGQEFGGFQDGLGRFEVVGFGEVVNKFLWGHGLVAGMPWVTASLQVCSGIASLFF